MTLTNKNRFFRQMFSPKKRCALIIDFWVNSNNFRAVFLLAQRREGENDHKYFTLPTLSVHMSLIKKIVAKFLTRGVVMCHRVQNTSAFPLFLGTIYVVAEKESATLIIADGLLCCATMMFSFMRHQSFYFMANLPPKISLTKS